MMNLRWQLAGYDTLIPKDCSCVYAVFDCDGCVRAGQSMHGGQRVLDVIREFAPHFRSYPRIWVVFLSRHDPIDGIERYVGEALSPRAAIRYPSVEPVPCSLPPTAGNALSQLRPAHHQMFGGIGNILSRSQPAQNALSDNY
jgi:hypothetical protein